MLAVTAQAKPQQEVQDLRYGVALYHFFQQDYFPALTELLVGEQQQDVPNHAEQAELLRGGISLSYGLDREAEAIFNRLLNAHRTGEQRDQAWFYLAKLQYLRGDNVRSQAALEKIGQDISGELNEERAFMHANLMLRNVASGQADLAAADRAAEALSSQSAWWLYYQFNRGVLQSQLGDWQGGVASLARLSELPILTEETKSLRDRAYTAAGFAYLAGADYASAQQNFQQVRLTSPLVDRALLGYGWAAAQQQQYAEALKPWQTLREGNLLDASVQESLLAIPYAYEKLSATGAALHEYQTSLSILDRELTRIEQAIVAFNTAPTDQLFAADNNFSKDWFVADEALLINEQAPYITHLITRQDFQNNLKELRELKQLADYLRQGKHRLTLLNTVMQERQAAWQQKVAGDTDQKLQARHGNLQQQIIGLEQTIVIAEQAQDGLLLMGDNQLALYQRVNRGLATAAQLAQTGQDVTEEVTKLKFFEGVLKWQASEQFVPRLWALEQQQIELHKLFSQSDTALARVKQLSQAPAEFGYGERISQLQARLTNQLQQVVQQQALAEQGLREQAVAELQRQRSRLFSYQGQARLAIARLYDQGSTGSEVRP